MADLAQIVISAIDKTGEAFTSVKTSMRQVELGGASLRDRLGDLVGLVSVGMFTAGVKAAIDYADRLDELSQITGVTVETLDGLAWAAKMGGVEFETLAKGAGKMQKALFDAAAGNKELSTLFGKLGVDVAKGMNDTEGALMKVADQFASMPDGAEKSALAMKLFGKAGADLIPLLNEGSEGLKRYKEEQERWGGVSTETASRAAAFNDTIDKLRMMSGALFREIAAAVLPTLQALANMFVEAKEKAGGFREAGEWVNTGLKMMASLALAGKSVFMMLGEAVGGVGALIGAFFKGELFSTGGAILEGMKDRIVTIYDGLGGEIGRVMDAVPAVVEPKAKKAGKDIASALAAGMKDGFASLMADLEKKLAGSMSPYNKEVVETEIKLREFERTTRKLSDTERQSAIDKAFLLDKMKLQKELLSQLSAAQQEYDDAITADIVKGDQILKTLTDGNESLKVEIELIGSSAKVRALRNVELERERALSGVIDSAQREKINREYDVRAALIAQREVLVENNNLWMQGAELAGGAAQALSKGFGSAVDYAKQQLKSLGAEMLAILGRKWFLEIGASLTGNSSLSALAGQQGQGSLAGSLLNALSGGGSGGSLLGNLLGIGGSMAGSMGAGIAGFGNLIGSSSLASFGSGMASVNAGVSMAGMGGAGGLGASVGNFMAAAGPWVAAIAAIYALHKAFGDKGENWKGQLGFGSAANAYTTQGVFGVEGFANLQGNDATNRSIQAFMAGTGGIDKLLAGSLSGGQMSAIQAQLQGYNRRTDGQPAEFAFSKDDKTAAAQLTLEYLKVKYGAVFDQIDSTFADYVRQYTGTSETLVQEIGVFADLISQLAGTSIKGLSLANLRAMQAEGEELGATLQRLGQGMALVNSIGVEQTDEFLTALRFVQDEFAAAGVTLPVSVDSYRQLREQIDFSTESGRAMYDMLVRVAPAMQSIEQATAAMLASFNQNLAAIFGNASSRASIEGQAIPLVQRFQALTGLLGGQNPLDVFKGIAGSSAGELTNIFNTYGGEAAGLLNQILELYRQYIAIQEQVNTTTQTTGLVMSNNNTVFTTFVDNMGEARASLQRYLAGSLLNQQLSPLTLQQQKEFAKQEFERLALLAPGSADAMNQLGGARDAYLSLLRQLEGSGAGYNAEFFRTFDVTRGIAGGGPTWQSLMQSALPSQGARMASDQDVAALRQDIQQLTLALLQGDRETAERIADALEQQTEKLQQSAYQGGPMGMTA